MESRLRRNAQILPPVAGPLQVTNWDSFWDNMQNDRLKSKLTLSMQQNLQSKKEIYQKKIRENNKKIINEQVKLLRDWCKFTLKKSWLYYIDEATGYLREISTDKVFNLEKFEYQDYVNALYEMKNMSLDESIGYINRSAVLRKQIKGNPNKDTYYEFSKIADYLKSMSITKKNMDRTTEEEKRENNRNIAKTLQYIHASQCESFPATWKSTPGNDENASVASRMIASGEEAMASIKESNTKYFDGIKESQRIMSILDRIKVMENTSLETRYSKLKKSLKAFNDEVIGTSRSEIKNNIARVVTSFSVNHQSFQHSYLNISLTGPPGVGKTTMARFIGDIFASLGILIRGDEFSEHQRSTLVGQYIGTTADKVRQILIKNIEGVVFIDEAYSLTQASGGSEDAPRKQLRGGGDRFDQFGVEAINEIVNFLDKHRGQICVIAAGYEREMKKYFFGVNPGMPRRFKWYWKLNPFESNELFCILKQKLLKTYNIEFDVLMDVKEQDYIYSVFKDLDSIKIKDKTLSTQQILRFAQKTLAGYEAPDNDYSFGLRDYFQNEGGDIENLAADFASVFYVLGRRQLSNDLVQEVLWQYISQRDGKVNIERGESKTFPPFFTSKDIFTGHSFDMHNSKKVICN